MRHYLIGAGATVDLGNSRSPFAPVVVHAQLEPLLGRVGAALIDLEAGAPERSRRVIVVVAGWSSTTFATTLGLRLGAERVSSLTRVAELLVEATGLDEVACFARWLAPERLTRSLARRGARLIGHPPEAIERLVLVERAIGRPELGRMPRGFRPAGAHRGAHSPSFSLFQG